MGTTAPTMHRGSALFLVIATVCLRCHALPSFPSEDEWTQPVGDSSKIQSVGESLAVTNAPTNAPTAQCIADDKPCTGHGGNDTPCMELGPDSWTDDNGPHNTVKAANQAACCAAAKTARTKVGHAVNWWTWNPSNTSGDGTCDIWTGPDSWKTGPGIRNPPVPRSGYENSMSGWSRPPIPPWTLCCQGSVCFQPDQGASICVHRGPPPHPSQCMPQVKTSCCLNGNPGDPTRAAYCNSASGCSGPCPPPPPPTPPPTEEHSYCKGSCKSDADCVNHGNKAWPWSKPQGCSAWTCQDYGGSQMCWDPSATTTTIHEEPEEAQRLLAPCTDPVKAYDQCGGTTWSGSTCCDKGYSCTGTEKYKECEPPKGQCIAVAQPCLPHPTNIDPHPAPCCDLDHYQCDYDSQFCELLEPSTRLS